MSDITCGFNSPIPHRRYVSYPHLDYVNYLILPRSLHFTPFIYFANHFSHLPLTSSPQWEPPPPCC